MRHAGRRGGLLVVVAVAAAAAGAAGGAARPTAAERAPATRARPGAPLAQEAGRLVILRFRGPALPPYVRRAFRERRADGVSVVLAPVADVPGTGASALAGRAFATEPDVVADAVGQAVEGFAAGGVAAAVKHFPGLGDAPVNTDDGPVTITRSPPLAPFRAAVRAGAPVVMVGHARYPALDPGRIASQSPVVVDDTLRRRLGFRGVAVTDSLEAAAVLETGSAEDAARRSVSAGIDLILTTGPGSYLRVYRELLDEARRSPAFARRVRTSARRVRGLQTALRASGRQAR